MKRTITEEAQLERKSLMPESGLLSQEPAVTWGLAWGIAAGVSEGSGDVFNRHLQDAIWDHSTSLHPPFMTVLPCGGAPPLGGFQQISECWSLGTLYLSLWSSKRFFQLFDVALVKPVHLLLGAIWCLLHLDGLPHCKKQKCVVAQSQNH